jgi:hypothetical protein
MRFAKIAIRIKSLAPNFREDTPPKHKMLGVNNDVAYSPSERE